MNWAMVFIKFSQQVIEFLFNGGFLLFCVFAGKQFHLTLGGGVDALLQVAFF